MVGELTQDSSEAEQLGFSKGALSVLTKEREEMQRIVSIVEQLIHMHSAVLKEKGEDVPQEGNDLPKRPKKPIEDLL